MNTFKQNTLKTMEEKLEKANKDVNKKEDQIKMLLSEFTSGLFSSEQVRELKAKYDKDLSLLSDEKDVLETEVNKLRLMKSNKLALIKGKDEIMKLGKKLSSQMMNMPLVDRRKFMDYFIPKGSYIEIFWRHPDDYYLIGEGIGRRIKVTWSYSYRGVFSLQAVIEALKSYSKTKEIPDYNSYLSNRDIAGGRSSYLPGTSPPA